MSTTMKRSLFVLWVFIFVLGMIGVAQRMMYGHLLANYTSYVPWGLWVAGYIYFVGMSAGLFFLSLMVYVFRIQALQKAARMMLLLALSTLLMGLLSIWFDLGHMFRIWRVFITPQFSSMMAWMIWLYTGYFVLLLAMMWLLFRAEFVRRSRRPGMLARLYGLATFGKTDLSPQALERDRRWVRNLGIFGLPLAICFSGGVGALFGVIGARPHWHTALFPILFLGSALASGSALLTTAVALFWPERDEAWRRMLYLLGRIVLAFLFLYVVLEWAEISIALYGSIPAHTEGLRLMLFGPFWWAFWIVHLLIGVVVPALLLVLRPKLPAAIGIASALIAATFLSVRLNIIIPGLAYSEMHGISEAFYTDKLSLKYVASTHEWLVMLFVVAVGSAIFYLGMRFLPIVPNELDASELDIPETAPSPTVTSSEVNYEPQPQSAA